MESRYNSDAMQLKRSIDRSTDHDLTYRFTDKKIDDQIRFRCTVLMIQFRCILDAIWMQ